VSENNVVARPYAKASFEFALKRGCVGEWKTLLQGAAVIAADPLVKKALIDPNIGDEKVVSIIFALTVAGLDQHRKNFLHLLAANKRVVVLPAIYQLFENLRLQQQRNLEVEVISAFPLTEQRSDELSIVLKKRFEHEIILRNTLNKGLY